MRKHYVTFESPGTLFSETTTQPIVEWDPRIAVGMSETIFERYNAKPYGFRFTTRVAVDPVPDGEGGFLNVQEREVTRSGLYYLGGRLRTVDEVRDAAKSDEEILLSNMVINDIAIVVENTKFWKVTRPFEEIDVIVDAGGAVVERGDTVERIAYRAAKAEEHRRKFDEPHDG